MNKQIRRVGYFIALLFVTLFVALNYLQVFQASALADNPANTRSLVDRFSSPRGSIITADGVTIAESVPADDQYQWQRTYPQGELYANVTGFYSFNFGSEGVERQYDEELSGRKVTFSQLGDFITDQVTTQDVTLTISDKVQRAARDALGDYRGAVVAVNPSTGAILGMYSNPTYDPNPLTNHDFAAAQASYSQLLEADGDPALARAYRQTYAPGSTFKVVTAAAAYDYDEDLVTKRYPTMRSLPLPNSGGLSLGNFGGSNCGGDLPQLLLVSCNSGFGLMGIDLGGENLVRQAEEFGFNTVPPVDLPAAAASNFPSLEEFERNIPRLAYSAIGQQDVTASPLQMALVAAGVGNDGVIMDPHVMSEIRDTNGNVVRTADLGEWKRAMPSENAEELNADMVQVAARGTATRAAIPGVSVAGKTGTAERGDGNVNAWLISFAPSDNPEVAVAVVLENQRGNSEATGGTLAAPIARQVMQAALGTS